VIRGTGLKRALLCMTLAVPGTTPLSLSSRAPSIVVVGADTLLGALPATPVQLAHACLRAGFQHVVPSSWGDELVAGAALLVMQQRPQTPVVQCSCPLVAHRLLSVGTDLRPFLVSLVSPPVALARYLRSLYGAAQLHITYIGRCPGAGDESIDVRMVPEDLFELFREQHIVVEDQPDVFDSVIPPDRRRYFSQPGGIPTVDKLWSSGGARTLVEIAGDDLAIELAQLLLADAPVLVDLAPALGCVCSGRSGEHDVASGRALLASLEPPRASTPVVDTNVAVVLEVPLHSPPTHAANIASGTGRSDTTPSDDEIDATFVRHPVVPPAPLPYHSELVPPPDLSTQPSGAPTLAVADQAALETHSQDALAEPVVQDVMQLDLGVLAPDPTVAPAANPVSALERSAAEQPDEPTPAAAPAAVFEAAPALAEALSFRSTIDERRPFAGAAVERYTPPKRRTPVHGIARIAQGDVPMARDSAGRSLPRAYASHRRQSFALRLTEINAIRSRAIGDAPPGDAPESGGNGISGDVPANESPSSRLSAPEIPVVAEAPASQTAPAPHADETIAERVVLDASPKSYGTPSAAAATVAELKSSVVTNSMPMLTGASTEAVRVAVERPELPRAVPRAPDLSRPQEHERPVVLPVERLSDRRSSTRVREAVATTTRTAEAIAAPPAARAPDRNWTLLLVIVALVALLSAAAGIAIGAWYMTHRP
jgi:Iron only hydrogenase large subunit, C-terminal domain